MKNKIKKILALSEPEDMALRNKLREILVDVYM